MAKFVVPAEQQHAYKMAVQRANRRIKANLKYIEKNNITNNNTKRALVRGYWDSDTWAGDTMPLSRSNQGRYVFIDGVKTFKEFESKRDFDQYLNYLNHWGKEGRQFDANPKQIISDYKSTIIKALNEVKDHYNITLPGGQLPKEVLDALNDMTIEEITNFYGNGDPGEDMEISQFSSDDYINVETADDFISVVISRISMVKKFNTSDFADKYGKYIDGDIISYYRNEHRAQEKRAKRYR